jgi:hypothetical protein
MARRAKALVMEILDLVKFDVFKFLLEVIFQLNFQCWTEFLSMLADNFIIHQYGAGNRKQCLGLIQTVVYGSVDEHARIRFIRHLRTAFVKKRKG